MSDSASPTRRRGHAGHFDQTDPSVYMLGLPKSRSIHWNWFVFALLTAAALAIGLVALVNLMFEVSR
jgi:hypothetical protein